MNGKKRPFCWLPLTAEVLCLLAFLLLDWIVPLHDPVAIDRATILGGWLLLAVTGVVLAVLLAGLLLGKFQGPLMRTSITLILAGGLGNLLDRAFHPGGFVVDYIYFEPINFPIFNLADICVCVGTFLLAFYILFVEGKQPLAEGSAPAGEEPPPEENA